MAHVGIDKALTGSLCVTKDRESITSCGKLPSPNKNSEWPWKPSSDVPAAHAKAKRPKLAKARFRGLEMLSLSWPDMDSRSPSTWLYQARLEKQKISQ